MEATPAIKPVKINRLLPYWAVFQADLRQTLRSWVYRTWVLVSVLSAIGYLLYRLGVYREAGIVQNASSLMSDLLRWCVYGSVTLVIIMTAGSISAERGTLADSILSRGISRYQYFLGKWHARLAAVLGTFLCMGAMTLTASLVLLNEDLSGVGSLLALVTVAALLGLVISCGVTMSAIFNSTMVGIAVLWITIYGLGFVFSLMPGHMATPYQAVHSLPAVLRGEYNFYALMRFAAWSAAGSCLFAIFGAISFSRRDV